MNSAHTRAKAVTFLFAQKQFLLRSRQCLPSPPLQSFEQCSFGIAKCRPRRGARENIREWKCRTARESFRRYHGGASPCVRDNSRPTADFPAPMKPIRAMALSPAFHLGMIIAKHIGDIAKSRCGNRNIVKIDPCRKRHRSSL